MKKNRLRLTALLCAFLGLFGASSLFAQGGATNPASGSLNAGDSAVTLTWQGTATGGPSSAAEQIDGVNRDFFVLTVNGAPADWVGKVIDIDIRWMNPASDYDLEVHKGAVDGPQVASSGSGPPSTVERVTISPESQGTGVFYINALYFAVADAALFPYTGSAKILNAPQFRSATYTTGGMTFSPNITTKTPTGAQDGEPSSRCDYLGNYYISGIRGVPAGNDLWYVDLRPTLAGGAPNPLYDPRMRNPLYRGQPDAGGDPARLRLSAGALGGGDVDLAVGFSNNTDGLIGPTDAPVLAFSSLLAANIPTARITNQGKDIRLNPAGNAVGGVPVNDREWQEAFGSQVFFLEYRNFAAAQAFISRSSDGGLTYPTSTSVGDLPQTGSVDVDQFDGTIYIGSNDGRVAVGTPPVPGELPLTFAKYQATPQANVANIFFVAKVADDKRNPLTGALIAPGTVYVCFSNGANIYVAHSDDQGKTWSDAVQVNQPGNPMTKVNLLPWFETGPTEGSLGIVWYGTDSPTNDDNARWRAFYAQTFNAKAAVPAFRVAQASDHAIHGANISLSGLAVGGESPNRNLIDYFQIAFDPTGAAVIGYTDDHNDFQGNTFVTRQISGPSIKGGSVPRAVEGGNLAATILPENKAPGANDPQVSDFAQDQDSGLLITTPTNSPADILSVKYNTQVLNRTDRLISATMTVSELTAVPPASNWRMHFTANAPEATLNSSGTYSNGISDRGDQFYVEARTNASGVPSYRWGTAVRNFDGSLSYTDHGAASAGSFDTAKRTITVQVTASTLNAYMAGLPGGAASHPPVVGGSAVCGLRGSTFIGSSVAVSDATRGGTQFAVTKK